MESPGFTCHRPSANVLAVTLPLLTCAFYLLAVAAAWWGSTRPTMQASKKEDPGMCIRQCKHRGKSEASRRNTAVARGEFRRGGWAASKSGEWASTCAPARVCVCVCDNVVCMALPLYFSQLVDEQDRCVPVRACSICKAPLQDSDAARRYDPDFHLRASSLTPTHIPTPTESQLQRVSHVACHPPWAAVCRGGAMVVPENGWTSHVLASPCKQLFRQLRVRRQGRPAMFLPAVQCPPCIGPLDAGAVSPGQKP